MGLKEDFKKITYKKIKHFVGTPSVKFNILKKDLLMQFYDCLLPYASKHLPSWCYHHHLPILTGATFRRWHPPHREVRPALTTVQENEAAGKEGRDVG